MNPKGKEIEEGWIRIEENIDGTILPLFQMPLSFMDQKVFMKIIERQFISLEIEEHQLEKKLKDLKDLVKKKNPSLVLVFHKK
jgi:hypothetical protein